MTVNGAPRLATVAYHIGFAQGGGAGVSPSGIQGRSPGRGSGGRSPQKMKLFGNFAVLESESVTWCCLLCIASCMHIALGQPIKNLSAPVDCAIFSYIARFLHRQNAALFRASLYKDLREVASKFDPRTCTRNLSKCRPRNMTA